MSDSDRDAESERQAWLAWQDKHKQTSEHKLNEIIIEPSDKNKHATQGLLRV